MKKIFTSGLLITVSIGIIIFLIKFILGILTNTFEPLILLILPGKNSLVVPLSAVLTILIILLVGFLSSLARVRKIFNKILKKTIPRAIEKRGGAVLEVAPGIHIIVAVIKEIKWKNLRGEITRKYVLFSPSSPIPTSGLPIIFASPEKVILLKISYGEFYGIISSFGQSMPELIEELKLENTG